jgi:hypothetical protein
MAWFPISGLIPQATANGNQANGMVLKFYWPGTLTPLAMATTKTGLTQTVEFLLDVAGYATLTGTRVIPHAQQVYKVVLYLNQADADANNTGSAVYMADNVDVGRFATADNANQPITEPRYFTGGANVFETSASSQVSASSFIVNVAGVTQRPIDDYTVDTNGDIVLVGVWADDQAVDITFWQPTLIVPGIGVGMVTAGYDSDGITTDFAIPASGSILAADMINTFSGVVQESGTDFTIVGGTHVRTVGTLPAGIRIVIRTTRI